MIKTPAKIFLVVLGIAIIAVGFYYYFYPQPQVNYLIPGVPYYGFFNHFFAADSWTVTSAADVLGYWGDERFSLADLVKQFPLESISSTLDLSAFFKTNGYETYRWASSEAGSEINEIKKFVNPEKKIPVIVYQKRSVNPARIANGSRVVIGIFDSEKKIIAHDHDFGNNYEISYKDFEAMFEPNARAILAVWPSETLIKEIKGPDSSRAYPARWPEMAVIGQLLLMKGADSIFFYYQGDKEKAMQLQQELVADESFSLFPPAHQVFIYGSVATLRLEAAKNDLAALDAVIQFINDKILPLNNNLSQPHKNWTEQIEFFKNHNYNEDKFVWPYYLLGSAYLQKGDKELARKNFEEALKINPDYKLAQEALKQLK